MTATALHSLAAFERALAAHARVLLFKHSPTCAISGAAHAEYAAFCRAHPDAPTLCVDVLADRAVARRIAAACGVRHESPQAILFAGGRPHWHRAHHAITAAALAAAWAAE